MHSNVDICTVDVGIIGTNCYIVYHEKNRQAIIVDPGDDAHKIIKAVDVLKVQPMAIMLTHGHFDHILVADKIANKYNIDIYASRYEKELLADVNMNLSGGYRRDCAIKEYIELEDNQDITIAGIDIHTISTPGHTSGSMCYLLKNDDILLSGDMLFRESVGRSDLATGDEGQIIDSLNNRLMELDDDIEVYPGHGMRTTIGYERRNNMYVIERCK